MGVSQQGREGGGCEADLRRAFARFHGRPPFLTSWDGICGGRRLRHHAMTISSGRAPQNQASAGGAFAGRGEPGGSSPAIGGGEGGPASAEIRGRGSRGRGEG